MAKGPNQKLKLLVMEKLFEDRSDEQHVLSVKEIIAHLDRQDIAAERKTIYDDIATLQAAGMDIRYRREKPAGYYLAQRTFRLPELKLLVDAVQSSKFITRKKSDELIRKLEGLTSHYQASQLQRQVYVTNRIKTPNESIFQNVDVIHEAIFRNVKIRYQYAQWTVKKQTRLRRDGQFYEISPWALCWDDENYYMIGYDDQAEMIKHYRVDKMLKLSLTSKAREGKKLFDKFDMATYSRQTFSMFHGKTTSVTLICANYLVGTVIDRFGQEVFLHEVDSEHFSCSVTVNVSPHFFGWLMALGEGIQIKTPELRREYASYVKRVMSQYGDCEESADMIQ